VLVQLESSALIFRLLTSESRRPIHPLGAVKTSTHLLLFILRLISKSIEPIQTLPVGREDAALIPFNTNKLEISGLLSACIATSVDQDEMSEYPTLTLKGKDTTPDNLGERESEKQVTQSNRVVTGAYRQSWFGT
jgi:hypothetical protein